MTYIHVNIDDSFSIAYFLHLSTTGWWFCSQKTEEIADVTIQILFKFLHHL